MEKDNNPFGKTIEAVHNSWLNSYHQAGVAIMVSAFGATEFPASGGLDPIIECSKFANFVKDNNLDGIDLDFEDNAAMNRVLIIH